MILQLKKTATIRVTTLSPDETENLGRKLGEVVIPGDIVLLEGDLGAGKSVFSRGVLYGMGLSESFAVRSPTFTIVNEYETTKCPARHIDLYRTDGADDIENIGVLDPDFNGVSIIEWAGKLDGMVQDDGILVTITSKDDDVRELAITGAIELLEKLGF